MPVMERESIVLPPELRNLPEVEYPPEVIERLELEAEIAEMQIAAGQLKIYDNVKDLFLDMKRNNG